MWVSKHNEFIGSSSESFEEAAQQVVARANRTLRGLTGIEVVGKRLKVEHKKDLTEEGIEPNPGPGDGDDLNVDIEADDYEWHALGPILHSMITGREAGEHGAGGAGRPVVPQ